MSLETAMSIIREKRNADPSSKGNYPDPIPAFVNQLKRYEATLAIDTGKTKMKKSAHGKKRKASVPNALPAPKRTYGPMLPPSQGDEEGIKIRSIGPSLPPPDVTK